jgi:hypothetical protein
MLKTKSVSKKIIISQLLYLKTGLDFLYNIFKVVFGLFIIEPFIIVTLTQGFEMNR